MGAIAYMNDIYPAGATSARESVYDNTDTGLPANVQGAIDQTTENIGQIEVGDNAVYNHAAGETFIWKGQFVKVGSTAIEAGSAISSKVSPTTISAILSEINSKITANKIGQGVALSNTSYIAPSDGYVCSYAPAGTSVQVIVYGNDGANAASFITVGGSSTNADVLFVKKGMSLTAQPNGTGAEASYKPIS